MNRALLAIVAFLLLANRILADDAATGFQPKSVAAAQAETKYNADMRKLDADYEQKAAVIKQAYLDGLKSALKQIARDPDADPDEIARISARLKAVQDTVVQRPAAVAASAVPATAAPAQEISGKWSDTWTGDNWGGTAILTFNKDKTVSDVNGAAEGTWMQDGMNVVHFYGGNSTYCDKLALSKDKKSMSGISVTNHASLVYTYLGN
jgi:hypothetical protein